VTDPLYIRLGLTVRGPYSRTDLHELAARGNFSKSHEVSADKKSWTSASNYPELFPVARRRQAAEGKPQNAEIIDEGKDSKAPPILPSSEWPAVEARQLTEDFFPDPNLSKPAIWIAIIGPAGFILLLVCTAMIVLRLRLSPFKPSENIGLIILLCMDIVFGGVAIALGYFAIRLFHQHAGAIRERNLIVIGLSCGYTILILCLLYFVVLLISAFG